MFNTVAVPVMVPYWCMKENLFAVPSVVVKSWWCKVVSYCQLMASNVWVWKLWKYYTEAPGLPTSRNSNPMGGGEQAPLSTLRRQVVQGFVLLVRYLYIKMWRNVQYRQSQYAAKLKRFPC